MCKNIENKEKSSCVDELFVSYTNRYGCRKIENVGRKRMKRVKLIVAYDGTNYCGWQIQPNGETIESVLNRHLSALLGEDIVVTGASRTDSGVHSLGNVAIFDTETRMPADKISFALNQKLPADIVV